MIETKLDGIRACERRGFAESQLARVVLLKLPRSSHAVIAKTHSDGRCLLTDLECAVAAFNDILNLRVQPWIGNSVDCRGHGFRFHRRGWHGGQPGDDRTDR